MMTNDRSAGPERRLANAIAGLFRDGIRLNDAAWHFINSTFFHPSVEELCAVLSDESNPEREPLLELIFFPDTDQQAALENEISQGQFVDGDETGVLSFLVEAPCEARLAVPGEGAPLKVVVPEWAAGAFLRRLHIGKQLDPRLSEAVVRFVPDDCQVRISVGLRNSRFVQTEKKVRFLCHFFKETASKGDDFFSMFEFLLGFLDEIGNDVSIYRALADRKRACFRSLQQALKFEAQLARHNIETLLLQGVRAPHIDQDDMRRKMVMIDQVCYAVFGRIEPVGDDPAWEDVNGEERTLGKNDDIAGMIRSLS